MSAIFSSIFTPLSAFFTAIIMAFTNLFGAWFGFIEEPVNPEDPDVGTPAIVYETDDPAEVAAFYVEASDKTRDDNMAPAGYQTMLLDGEITCDGAAGTILNVLNPIVSSALASNTTETDYIPGASRGDLLPSDITECHLVVYEDGSAYIYANLKEQVDGPDCDGHVAGPVARGIGTIGSVDTALEELGAEITSGRDTISLTYRDAYIECEIDADGYIVSGTWHYYVDILVLDIKAKISIISANIQNLRGTVEYTVVI